MGHFQPTSASAGGSGFWLFSAWPSSPWASLKPKQTQLPIQRLILILFIEATTVLDITMEATGMVATLTTATTARDLLKLSLPPPLRLTLRLELTPGMDTMVVVATATAATGMVATLTTAITARDLLRLSPLLPPLLMPRLMLIPGMDTTVDLDTTVTAAMAAMAAMAMAAMAMAMVT